jgi:hypothetical protein
MSDTYATGEGATLGRPLLLTHCEGDHATTWVEGTESDWWGVPTCPWCLYTELAERHDRCHHAGHGRWRRWQATHKVAGWLYALGVIAGWGINSGVGCNGCVVAVIWRRTARRPYLLGVSRESWHCLRAGHWPGESIGLGLCGKCLPCPGCGSVTNTHRDGCRDDIA